MVATRIAAHGITDPAVLAAMRTVPGEAFVRADLAELAYDDTLLSIGAGQTILQPYRRSPEHAPYAGIVVAAGGPRSPRRCRNNWRLAGVVKIQYSDIVEGYTVMILGPW